MVQFIREQTRHYAADQTSAIRTGQMAQTVSDWNTAIKGAANAYSAFQKGVLAREKELETADKNIIATEFGKTAHNATINELDKLAEKHGVGTEAFKKEAYALADRNYAPQIEKMQTEKYKVEMESRLRDTKDVIDTYKNTRRAKAIEGTKAEQAANNLAKGFGEEAYQQGARQEYSDIRGVDDYVKFASKKTGLDKEDVKAAVEKDIAIGRMLGVIDNDIITAASALGDEEILRDHFTDMVNSDPKLSELGDTKKEKAIQKLIDDETLKSASDEHLRSVLGEAYIDSITKSYTKDLSEQKVALQKELSVTNPKSQKAKDLREKLDTVKGKIEAVEEGEILDVARKELRDTLLPIEKQRYAEYKQQIKVDRYNNSVSTWANALDPDPLTAQKAKWEIWASENGLMDERQNTKIGEWESKNMSKANPLMSPITDEVNVEQLASDYQQYIKNSETVKPQLHETYEGTMAMHDALQDLWNTPDLTPIQAVALGYKAINAMYEAPITEDQRQTFNNLVVRAIQDRGFGDMANAVLENGNRYYPDTNWMSNAFSKEGVLRSALGFTPSLIEESGLPSGGVRRTDVDNVKKMMDARTQKAINSAMHSMVEVASLPKEQQAVAFQQISDALVQEKKNIFDEAMMNYGIDLKYLDNELNTKGKAYTRIGFAIKEYKGRDSNGMPLFADAGIKDQVAEANKILQILTGINKKGE